MLSTIRVPYFLIVLTTIIRTQAAKMKFALVVLVLLPFALGATIDEKRFIESLLGGFDILDLGSQLACQFGKDETEAQCEHTLCPQLVDKITHNTLIQDLLCVAVCKEAQVLVKNSHHLHCAGAATGAGA